MQNGRQHHSSKEVLAAGMTDAASWEQNINNVLMEGIYTNSDFKETSNNADVGYGLAAAAQS